MKKQKTPIIFKEKKRWEERGQFYLKDNMCAKKNDFYIRQKRNLFEEVYRNCLLWEK